MAIGQKIKSLRESKQLTQEELDIAIGVNKATVNRYEAGIIDIKRTVAVKLAEVLNTTPAYIMGWEDDNVRENYYAGDEITKRCLELFLKLGKQKSAA